MFKTGIRKEIIEDYLYWNKIRDIMDEAIFRTMAIPYPMLSDNAYDEFIHWLIATGQLEANVEMFEWPKITLDKKNQVLYIGRLSIHILSEDAYWECWDKRYISFGFKKEAYFWHIKIAKHQFNWWRK